MRRGKKSEMLDWKKVRWGGTRAAQEAGPKSETCSGLERRPLWGGFLSTGTALPRKMAAPSEISGRTGFSSGPVQASLEGLETDDEPEKQLERLHEIMELLREQQHRETAPERVFQSISQILIKSSRQVHLACWDEGLRGPLEPQLQLLAECFRCLRNACVQCPGNQSTIRNLNLIDSTVELINLFQKLDMEQESHLAAFRCSLQFLGNIAAGNEVSQEAIWRAAFPDLFLYCLRHPDEKVVAYASMILFTCLNDERLKDLQTGNLHVPLLVIEAHRKQPDSEWAFLIISDYLLKSPDLVKAVYSKLSNPERVTLLDLMVARLAGDEPLAREDLTAFQSHAELVASRFQERCKSVLRLASEYDNDEEALATIRLLHVLCEMTANCELLGSLQAFPGLLETVVELLRLAHLAGKETSNVFTVATCMRGDGDIANPAAGFKSHLVRLIGNMCYKNRNNQDKVYELDGIPLILDNCSMDDNNPFLNQWAVYAIRNLTEHNKRNQELIAKMEDHGLADTTMLKKMGFEIEKQGGKLTLRSTRKGPTCE
ncbi:ataxin-10 [Antechinus flavipes]|uniref:ataxin-10 n=1 Tax=Antechinus flavipes TaxID=38775 RepID=UPI002236290B|nr:ataxin-10 [Antechinus flavipes]